MATVIEELVIMLRTPCVPTSGPGGVEADDAYSRALADAGFVPQCIPTLRFETGRHRAAVTAALTQPDRFAGLVFTSKQAVLAAKAVLDGLAPRSVVSATDTTNLTDSTLTAAPETPPPPAAGSVTETWARRPVFAVGKGTSGHVQAAFGNAVEPLGSAAGSAAELGGVIATFERVDVPDRDSATATADDGARLTSGLPAGPGSRAPLLFLCGDKARRDIDTVLTSAGVPFTRVVAYTTETQPDIGASVAQALAGATNGCPWLAFFSPSGVNAVMPHLDGVDGLPRFRVAAIGGTTANAVRSGDWAASTVHATALTPSADGLVAAIVRFG